MSDVAASDERMDISGSPNYIKFVTGQPFDSATPTDGVSSLGISDSRELTMFAGFA